MRSCILEIVTFELHGYFRFRLSYGKVYHIPNLTPYDHPGKTIQPSKIMNEPCLATLHERWNAIIR